MRMLLLSLCLLIAGCGRTYTLIGKVVFLATAPSAISEVKERPDKVEGLPIDGAKVTLFHELQNGQPKRDSAWSTSVVTDKDGAFQLKDYATPGKKNLVGLEVSMAGYETVFTTYYDYMEPDEQYFVVTLRKQV